MGNNLPVQPHVPGLRRRPEGSLRYRLLSTKVHQRQDSLWTPKPGMLWPRNKDSLCHIYKDSPEVLQLS
ncbi:hypothetical protein DPEC_G00094270 [Dallia pectoralis]|uniref:Uncharacterized protein n=1 Tax=Dallia pectoralis TaxID=75939 RepID=A0ACC2H0W6_DALPE|nr:hypothetical protein DPEC_G00094270 [Dallia pectoralis]